MSPASTLDELLAGRPLIAIVRGMAAADAVQLAHAVWDTGLGLVEVPIQTPAALAALRAVAAAAAERGEIVGAGTVVSPDDVAAAHAAGARFTVAPGLDHDVWQASEAAGLPHLPGVGTASEVHQAVRAGARWVKMFPAGALGADWLHQMRGPFPQLRYVATGGVDADNAADFLRAGAAALGVGSSLARPGGLAELVAVMRRPVGADGTDPVMW